MNNDIKALYDLTADLLMTMIDNRKYTSPANRREHMALNQISDATQCLYAACMNLGLIVDD